MGSAAFGAYPSNMILGPGEATPEGLLAAMADGLLVSDFWYTRILDPKTQVVTGLTRNGLFVVRGGEVCGAARNLRFTQSYVGALGPGRVLGIGNDVEAVGGMRLPSVRLAAWNFTGGAKG
jgi:predicted Zn-dependent protease